MDAIIKLGETVAARAQIEFTTVLDIDWRTMLDASLLTTLAVEIRKPDGTFVTEAGQTGLNGTNVTQPNLGAHARWQGFCLYTPTAAELNQLGQYTAIIYGAGINGNMQIRDLSWLVVAYDPYAVDQGVLTNQVLGKSPVDGVTDVTVLQALRVLSSWATHIGTLPAGAGNFNTRDGANIKNRIAGAVDANGVRTITTYDGT